MWSKSCYMFSDIINATDKMNTTNKLDKSNKLSTPKNNPRNLILIL